MKPKCNYAETSNIIFIDICGERLGGYKSFKLPEASIGQMAHVVGTQGTHGANSRSE
jgi:hypothetical protein